MTLQNTDKFLVNRGGASFQLEHQNFMTDLRSDDLLLVNRGGKSYSATGMVIQNKVFDDDDLFLVNRGGASYSVTGAEIKATIP